MAEYDYDLFVIGAGSGGVRAARFSANYGARVAVAEDRFMGGTCVNVGCIPKKLFVYASHFHEEFGDAEAYGWTVKPEAFDWRTLVENKDTEIKRLNGIYERLLEGSGVEIKHGRATVVDPHTVEVDGTQYTAENILVASGSWPNDWDFEGFEHVITSNEAFYLDKLPKRVLVAGAGYIAVEFAGIFNGLGVETTLVYRGDLIMRGFDNDIRHHLQGEMEKKGIDFKFNVTFDKVEKTDDGLKAYCSDGTILEADEILFAIGRSPNVDGLGLEEAGVKLKDNGAVIVDDYFRTSVPSIFAIGDVIDRYQLTPVALAEGMAVAKTLFRDEPSKVDYEYIATAVFSQPPVGTVGLTEAEAREQYGDVTIFKSSFKPLKHTLTGRDEQTFMKMIVDKATDKVVGIHMVGADAGEMMQGFAVALKAGATKAVFDQTIGIHPTSAEEFVTMRDPVPEEEARAAE
ncbi:MAG: glutathione-disulfide reductase [Alphaproteobacteria bacterium]|nr:glutathione-disulfide reductase [Alphaproteobacteria bacterium]